MATSRIVRRNGRRTFKLAKEWLFTHSGLNQVEKAYGLPAGAKLGDIINMAEKNDRKNPLNVVEWGCGAGVALSELAQKNEYGNRTRFFGFSDEAFSQWEKYLKAVSFIQAPATDFQHYLKKIRPGVIFSHYGLIHLSPADLAQHIKEIAPYLRPKGFIVTDYKSREYENPQIMIDIFARAGLKLMATGKNALVFQKD